MNGRIPAIVLSCQRYAPLAEHMIDAYASLWPEHPFLFRLPDGANLWMDGYFCCEMDPPEDSLVSVASLRSFAEAMDGQSP